MSIFGPPDIEKLISKQDIKGLSKALNYKIDASIRKRAAKALQQVGDSRATRSLIAALNDDNEDVRCEAAKALGDIGDAAAVPYLIKCPFTGKKDSIEALLYLDVIIKIGPAAVDTLCISLRDEDPWLRARSANALGAIGDHRAVGPLISALEDYEKSVPRVAAEALTRIRDTRAISPLISGLIKYENREHFRKALIIFGESAIDPLIDAIENAHEYIRKEAAIVLGEICTSKNVNKLISLCNSITSWGHAQNILLKIGLPAVDPLIDALKDDNNDRERIALLLGEIGDPRATIPLTEILAHEDRSVRRAALRALGKIGDPRATIYLTEFLNHKDSSVRHDAFEALGKIVDHSEVPALIYQLEHEDESARINAVKALGCLLDDRAISPLVELLQHEQRKQILEPIEQTLEKFGKAVVLLLIPLTQSPKKETQDTACHIICNISRTETSWEPDTEHNRIIFWLLKGEVYRLHDINLQANIEILIRSFDWDLEWYVKGRLAQLLLNSEMRIPADVHERAIAEFEKFIEQSADLLKSRLEIPQSFTWIDDIESKALFEDYDELVARASAYNSNTNTNHFSLSAVEKLCKIVSPVSSNLLHHISRICDIEVSRGIFEVPYDSDHPTGMGESFCTLPFQDHRETALKELARRDNPEYDPEIYREIDCWRLEEKTDQA